MNPMQPFGHIPLPVLHAGWLHPGFQGWGRHTQAVRRGTAGTGAPQSHHCSATSGHLLTGGAPPPADKMRCRQQQQQVQYAEAATATHLWSATQATQTCVVAHNRGEESQPKHPADAHH
jgi:hypothetical protein